ncbi:MAG: PspC domain-containing protein [Candidatus Kariarchaeaceae archaeon]
MGGTAKAQGAVASGQYSTASRRLTRSRTDRVFAGVCGGLGEHYNMDPNIVRLLWILLTFAGGAGILAYIIAVIFIPEDY